MDEIEVDWDTLFAAEDTWLGLAQDLQAAAEGLEEAPSSGFDRDCAPTVVEFLATWATVTAGMEGQAKRLNEDLALARRDYGHNESDVAATLDTTTKELE